MRKVLSLIFVLLPFVTAINAKAETEATIKEEREATVTIIDLGEGTPSEKYIEYMERMQTISSDTKQNLPSKMELIKQGAETLDQIVNTGIKVIDFAKANAATTEIDPIVPANAIPEGLQGHWELLTGFSEIQNREYLVRSQDLWGTTTEIRFAVNYRYGGSLKGKGKYLTGIVVEIPDASPGLTKKLKISTRIDNPDNAAPNAESTPIARITLVVSWQVGSKPGSIKFEIRGDGGFKVVNSSADVRQSESYTPEAKRTSPIRRMF